MRFRAKNVKSSPLLKRFSAAVSLYLSVASGVRPLPAACNAYRYSFLVGWLADDLHFFGFDEKLEQNAISLARTIATSVPSVRVVRLLTIIFLSW